MLQVDSKDTRYQFLMDLDQNLYKNLLIISFVYWEVINQNTVSGLPKIRWKKTRMIPIFPISFPHWLLWTSFTYHTHPPIFDLKRNYVNIAKKYTTEIISKAFCFVSFCWGILVFLNNLTTLDLAMPVIFVELASWYLCFNVAMAVRLNNDSFALDDSSNLFIPKWKIQRVW